MFNCLWDRQLARALLAAHEVYTSSSPSLYSQPYLLFSVFWITSLTVKVKWYLLVGLLCISLRLLILGMFKCVY